MYSRSIHEINLSSDFFGKDYNHISDKLVRIVCINKYLCSNIVLKFLFSHLSLFVGLFTFKWWCDIVQKQYLPFDQTSKWLIDVLCCYCTFFWKVYSIWSEVTLTMLLITSFKFLVYNTIKKSKTLIKIE